MTHGSLQKAGKVRRQTPKVPSKQRKSLHPRLRNKKNYYKRIIKGKPMGQPKIR